MNEEQLIEFVNWLPTAVPEFQNASPDQIVQSLNQMAESEEGQQMLSQLFTAFQESKQAGNSQMFKKGGKMAAFVNKYGNGGCVSCKKKEILRGGMVNKMAEKMEDGGKNRLDKKLNEVLRTEGDKISYRNVPEGVFSQESWKWKNLRRDALGTGRNPVGSFSRVIINSGTPKADTTYTFMPLTDPKDYIGTNANFITVSRKNTEDVAKYSDFLNNFDAIVDKYSTPETMKKGGELATMTSAETANNIGLIPMAQKGNQIPSNNPNQIAENTVLSILSSPRPFVQQNVTPTETREFYAYDRNRLPDNVGGPFNFEGAIRTITPSDTTITYQIPNQGIYGVASSKNRGSNWRFINSSMDKIKDKANEQKK